MSATARGRWPARSGGASSAGRSASNSASSGAASRSAAKAAWSSVPRWATRACSSASMASARCTSAQPGHSSSSTPAISCSPIDPKVAHQGPRESVRAVPGDVGDLEAGEGIEPLVVRRRPGQRRPDQLAEEHRQRIGQAVDPLRGHQQGPAVDARVGLDGVHEAVGLLDAGVIEPRDGVADALLVGRLDVALAANQADREDRVAADELGAEAGGRGEVLLRGLESGGHQRGVLGREGRPLRR